MALVLAGWTVFVWTIRIGNVIGDDDLSSGAKAGRVALALSFTALAAIVVWAALLEKARLGAAVGALGVWTLGVWVVRTIGIVGDDHSVGFVLVHVVLAVVSIALSWLAFRAALHRE